MRVLKHKHKQAESVREARDQARREADQASRTDDQRLGDQVSASLQPGVKQAGHAELIRSIHGGDE